MMEILEEQYGDRFVGRWEKIKELKAKIRDNRIVVVKGDRGIGKTNLMWVVHKTMETEGKECHFIRGDFHKRMGEIFKLPWFKRITSVSLPIIGGGAGWTHEEALRQSFKESEEKIIFVENAYGLDRDALERIFDAVCLNNKLRFILEVPTPHVRDFKLKAGSYSVINVEKLSHKDTVKLVKNAYYNFSNDVVEKIATKSDGYPYVARVLVYICVNKKSKERMHEFLDTLKDDEMHRLDQIHKEVLETLREEAQNIIQKLAIAPQILTYKLIEAFCGEETDIRDIVERGILRTEKEGYRVYHPLFRDYLKKTPGAEEKKKEIYSKAMGKIKSEFDSIHMLFEVLNEPDIFNELVAIADNYEALNYVASQSYTWGKLEPAIISWSRILTKSQDEKNKEWEAIATGNMGIVYRIKGELDKALEYYGKALKLIEELGSKEGMAINYGNMGNVYQIRGELDKALEYFGKALKLNEELGRKEGMAYQLGNMGIVYGIKAELDQALEYHKKALLIFRDMGSRIEEATVLMNIGDVFVKKGEKERAIDYYMQAQELATDSPPLFNDVSKRVNTLLGIKELEPAEKDPSFDLASLAVETGVTDLAVEHNHYLYGTPKRGKKNAR
jgi:tetratricopeptide (TPR) repeat protein